MKAYSLSNKNIIKEKSLIEALKIDIKKQKIITVVGAGGKTSTIFNLAKEISNLNKKVVVTTTTHMRLDKDFYILNKEEDIDTVKQILKKQHIIKVGDLSDNGKIKALDIGILKKLIKIADVILIEGDGSRGLPLKVPNESEPIIIDETNLVIGVVGIDSLNKKIEDICHRVNLVCDFLSKTPQDNIEYDDLVKIMVDRKGLRKNVDCDYKVIVNKVDSEYEKKQCLKIIEKIKDFNIDLVFTSYKE